MIANSSGGGHYQNDHYPIHLRLLRPLAKVLLVSSIMGSREQLYSVTTNQAAIITLFRVINGYVGNLAPMPGVFPDYPAPPVVRDVVASVLDCRYPALISWALTGNT